MSKTYLFFAFVLLLIVIVFPDLPLRVKSLCDTGGVLDVRLDHLFV